MANSAFDHNPLITVPGSSTITALVRWSGTGGKTFLDSTILVGATTMGLAADTNLLTFSSGTLTIDGTLAATTLTGSGAGITALAAANITASGTLPALNGAALTALNGTQVTSGTLPAARIAADSIVEAKLNVSNAPTNGQVLTARDGVAGGFTWEAAASGGVDTTGTPANDQIAVFTDVDTIEGNNNVKVVDGYIFTLASTMRINSGFAKIEMVTDGSPTADEWRVGADRSANAFLIENAPHTTGTPSFSTWFSLANTGDLTVKENTSMPSVTKGIAKAWGRVNGAGTLQTGDYNIDSATLDSAGRYTWTWTTDFENEYYTMISDVNETTAAGVSVVDRGGNLAGAGKSSTYTQVHTSDGDNLGSLPHHVVVFGEAT